MPRSRECDAVAAALRPMSAAIVFTLPNHLFERVAPPAVCPLALVCSAIETASSIANRGCDAFQRSLSQHQLLNLGRTLRIASFSSFKTAAFMML